jgi:nucleoside-diphosphate-sugar epimerase
MIFNSKKILITGATGLIGYNLACRLLEMNDVELILTGRSKKKLSSTYSDYQDNGKIRFLELDAAEEIPNDIGLVDYIFHAAGPMERDVIRARPVDVIMPNIKGTMNCLKFLKEQKEKGGKEGRLIIFSSVTVYNNTGLSDIVVSEDMTSNATSLDLENACYAESKRMSEVIAKSFVKQYHVDSVIVRFSTVYGFCKNIPDTAFFEFIKKAIKGENIQLNGTGFPRRDNIYIDDAIDGLLTVCEHGQSGESYNISSGGEENNYLAVDEIANLIADCAAEVTNCSRINIIVGDSKERRPGVILSNIKLKNLGWSLKINHREGIMKTIKSMI